MTTRLVHNISTNHLKKDINQDFKNIPSKGRKDSTKYFNCVLPTITQGYNFTKLQSLLEQNNFTNKPAISTNQTFRYIINLQIANKAQFFEYFKKMKKLPSLH
jgi:hypothetical protein